MGQWRSGCDLVVLGVAECRHSSGMRRRGQKRSFDAKMSGWIVFEPIWFFSESEDCKSLLH